VNCVPETREILDIRDRVCSEPVLKVKVALERCDSGEFIDILANDTAQEDIV